MTKKDDKKKTAEELNVLFKPVEQKVAKGAVTFFTLLLICCGCAHACRHDQQL